MPRLLTSVSVLLWALGTVSSAEAQRPAVACSELAKRPLKPLFVTQAVEVTTGKFGQIDSLPPFCRVVGVLRPVPQSEIAFEIWLPLEGWNGKLSAVGHGGFAGYINYDQPVGGGMRGQLRRGYAATSTNTGHVARAGLEMARFARDNPESLIDFAWRAQHEGAVVAKALVQRFYGRRPTKSYFFGASSGGRQALISAQRFPGDYDGIVAAAPAHDWTALFAGALDLYLAGAADTTARMAAPLLQRLAQAVVAACDADDGVTDSIISVPSRCRFDPETLACASAISGEDCLNPAQRALVRRAYDGWRDPVSDKLILPGFERGFEPGLFGHTRPSGPLPLMTSYYRWIATPDTTWTWRAVPTDSVARFKALLAERGRLAKLLDATDPDLSAFRARGGKLILYHGWNDEIIPPKTTINYLEQVALRFGGGDRGWRQVDSFVRLFLAPTITHAGWNHELQTSLESWVERGQAPERLMETLARFDGTEISRPLCRYGPVGSREVGCGGPRN